MTVAIIHNEDKPEVVNAVLDTEMTREQLLYLVRRLYEENQNLREDCHALLEMQMILERQNKRLLKEKFERMETDLSRRPRFLLLKSK